MAGFVRAKRVTDPLDDRVKARLVGRDASQLSYVSSGSEHSADDDDDSPRLSELVRHFLHDDGGSETARPSNDRCDCSDSEAADDRADAAESAIGSLPSSSSSSSGAGGNVDAYREVLSAHVAKAVEACSRLRSNRSAFTRGVMQHLRDANHNAAVCKTRWESSGGITAGNYEFIDVVVQSPPPGTASRYFIDVDFAAEFQIARPSSRYASLLQSLPSVFVGTAEELKRIVRAMCEAAKRSLRSRDLSVPPWRKNRYMQNKWLAPYRRTTNPVPETSRTSSFIPATGVVKCRWVGFDAGVTDPNVNGRLFVRTR